MTPLDQALALAARGFHVFPLQANSKLPAIKDYPTRATRDAEQIRKWWSGQPRNIGISTSRFGDDEALIVVDVDTKEGKHGDETLFTLDLEGKDFPTTLEHTTPSGGRHLIYTTREACKQGVDVLGSGLDIRSRGGYIVAPGSTIDGKGYEQINGHSRLAGAPGWLVATLGVDRRERGTGSSSLGGVSPDRALDRASAWLNTEAPIAVQSQGGDLTTYKVAARVKDFGCDLDQALALMAWGWNERCEPPWELDDLEAKIRHAYKYGREPQGAAAPEAVFAQEPPHGPPVETEKGHPFEEINRQFAFIKAGAFVLQETTNEDGEFCIERIPVADFHAWHANQPWAVGKEKPRPISMAWMEWKGRRQYDGIVFAPEQKVESRWYNQWRGFTVQPEAGTHPAVEAFKEHALLNVCGGDPKLFNWLMGYFAHMIQRPWEKPLVALVFKGAKGTGKNALIDRVGALLGIHYVTADNDRYLLGNFNSHLESNLCFVLDEAAWAGDKRAEGRLKGLITGAKHLIEHKGKEPRVRKNLSRIVIIGNEEWIVPATVDERRFAVFSLGDGRRQDRKFFIDMREGMEQGGYSQLLAYFQSFDLSTVDVNEAPNTAALIEQKHAGLELTQQWWLDCIHSGQIQGGDWGGEWPEISHTPRLREAFARWAKTRNIRSRLPEDIAFGRILKQVAPSFKRKKVRPEKTGDTSYGYWNPGLEKLRADWERYIGGPVDWPADD